MESTPDTQTPSLWTDEKHLHYLNTMEASFVRTMLHHYAVVSPLRLDRYLPDTSESTLDSKPKKQATADSMGGSRGRRTKRRSSSKNKVQNSSPAEEQVSLCSSKCLFLKNRNNLVCTLHEFLAVFLHSNAGEFNARFVCSPYLLALINFI
ncbi:uncharacterized protein LOC114370384 isoform X1 [Glycine soja]|uniref:Uncharacterized protein n=1 Tax=Glycine soja TaxID=3848 RepID=A0A0B2QK04_GLYSO|nr:uncharacterized protein LOC114370384 isoform X1 [Glycine soja]KAG4984205.1 hypothetical protein JHK87_028954 [Glycine soja]KHN21725.1 hypothetical protein glysoja_027609 [Glycine soja]RZB88811.1 hypothetical protein D0Y65_027949 [Glycine soja]